MAGPGWRGLKAKAAEGREGFLAGMWEELPRERAEVVYTISWWWDWRRGDGDKKINYPEHPKWHCPNVALLLLMQGNESVPTGGQCHKTHPRVLTNPESHPPSLFSDPFPEIRFHNSRHSVAAKPSQSTSSHVHCQCQAPYTTRPSCTPLPRPQHSLSTCCHSLSSEDHLTNIFMAFQGTMNVL